MAVGNCDNKKNPKKCIIFRGMITLKPIYCLPSVMTNNNLSKETFRVSLYFANGGMNVKVNVCKIQIIAHFLFRVHSYCILVGLPIRLLHFPL